MEYFETHAHPDHPLVVNKEEYISSMRSAGINKIVIAPITYESNFSSIDLFPADLYPEVYFAKGLHPKCAMNTAMWDRSQIAQFLKLLSYPRTIALKTGLDLCKKKIQEQQIQRQYDFLKMFMQMAQESNKPLVLHIREASSEALRFFEGNSIGVSAEIHCFAYDKVVMQRFIDIGINYFGIGGMVTRNENIELQEAVAIMPLEMILLESDAPFVKVEGETEKINTSSRALPAVATKIASLKGLSVEEIVRATTENAYRFFNLKRGD